MTDSLRQVHERFDSLELVGRQSAYMPESAINQIKTLLDRLLEDSAFQNHKNLLEFVRNCRKSLKDNPRNICANVIVPITNLLSSETDDARKLACFITDYL